MSLPTRFSWSPVASRVALPAETAIFRLTGAVPVGQAERSAASPDAKDVYELLPTIGLIGAGDRPSGTADSCGEEGRGYSPDLSR